MFALARFTIILTGLRAAVAAHVARSRAHTGFIVLLWGRLARASVRVETLFARWRSGTLPKPRPTRPRQPRAHREQPRLPTGRAWLLARIPESAALASQLQHLLSDPEIAEFLQAAPQAGRILRPLCHMLGILPLPENLRASRRQSRADARQAARRPSGPQPRPRPTPPLFVRLTATLFTSWVRGTPRPGN